MPSSDNMPQPIWIFDNPRTCSLLFHRIFKFHTQLEACAMHQWAIHVTFGGPERIQTRVNNRPKAIEAEWNLQSELKGIFPPGSRGDISRESYAVTAQRLEEDVEAAQAKDKTAFLKEHITCLLQPSILSELIYKGTFTDPPQNPINIPDALFKDIRNPLLQIRHPALLLPSWYKAQLATMNNDPDEDAFRMWTTQRMTGWLFDFLREQGRNPILVDAEDILTRPEVLCRRLCGIWEISSEGLRFNWDARAKAERIVHPFEHYCERFEGSTGFVRPENMAVDVDVEYGKWAKGFGEEVAFALKKGVDADMPDYLYLQQYRIKLG